MKTITKIKFTLGDKQYTVATSDVTPGTTLNTYLRDHLHLTGTKKMCEEGGCGACLVAVKKTVDGKLRTFTANSCLVDVLSCDGWSIQTNELIGGPVDGYNKYQKLLSDKSGTQCGFCSSGMVMNMYALDQDGPKTMLDIEDAFGGNLCRCTGYRPILDAAKQLATAAPGKENMSESPRTSSCVDCPSRYDAAANESYVIDYKTCKWIKVFSFQDLISTLGTYGLKQHRLIAGNTARGVFKNSPPVDVYINVADVPELTSWSLDLGKLSIGANTSLNRTIEILRNVSSKASAWSYLSTMADHIDLMAGNSIRNTATIAGNLMMKHDNPSFPSDMFLILEAFNAKLLLVDTLKVQRRVSPKDFLDKDMKMQVIKTVELAKLETPDSYRYATYKIMPRAQNSHAIVNAAFLIKLTSKNTTESASIVYGGVSSNFIHATKTEKYLVGKDPFTNQTLQDALKTLDSEVVPSVTPPDASAEYVKGLTLSLWYKFILKIAPQEVVDERLKSGGTIIQRPVSEAVQEFTVNTDMYPVGQPIKKLESLAQVSGRAEYIADMPDLPHQLYAAFVLTQATPNSTIISLDTSAALKVEGVVTIYTYKDIPGKNNFIPAESGLPTPEKLLCEDTVEFYNQPIAIVVADKYETALTAAAEVTIQYKKSIQAPLFTADEVLKAGDAAKDRLIKAASKTRTDTGNDVTKVLHGTYYMGNQYGFHMEVQCCNVIPTDDDAIDVYSSTQWMDLVQLGVGNILGIPNNKINVIVRRVGGAFGAKISRSVPVAAAAALAAFKLQRPVKMWLPFETNMRMVGSRIPLKMTYEVGINDDGYIQYFDGKYYSEYGRGVGNDYINLPITGLIGNCYNKDRWSYDYFYVQTDRATNSYIRAPGSAEAMGSTEAVIEHIAYTLGKDPWEVRMANYDSENDSMLKQFYETMKTWGELEKREQEVKKFNTENRWKKRGISCVPMKWKFIIVNRLSVLVSIFHGDGTVAIAHGGIEMGQGINTKVAQACAYKFGIDLDMVSVKPSYNVISPNTQPSAGSWTSESVVFNLLTACDELLARMEPIRKTMDNPSWLELVRKCNESNINLTCSGQKKTDFDGYDIYGMCVTEVEVDILTGQQMILRMDVIEDTGDSMSPEIDIGQVEGAICMGIGYYTLEEVKFSDDGEVLTNSTWNYKPPGAKDIPIDFRIKFPENNPNPIGILKSKATSEPPLCMTVGVPLAIKRALHSARQEANADKADWIPFDGAFTIEQTFLHSFNSSQQFVLN